MKALLPFAVLGAAGWWAWTRAVGASRVVSAGTAKLEPGRRYRLTFLTDVVLTGSDAITEARRTEVVNAANLLGGANLKIARTSDSRTPTVRSFVQFEVTPTAPSSVPIGTPIHPIGLTCPQVKLAYVEHMGVAP